MPGLPLVARETTNLGYSYNHSRIADQMCRQDSRVHLSAEEAIAAEESLSIYCKPVELYNILQRRAIRNPLFLQRCLHYKIQAKRKRRIQMTISLSGIVNDGLEVENLLPLYVLLAKPVSDIAVAGWSAIYRVSRACIITGSVQIEGKNHAEAKFVLPEINKLSADAKASKLTILLVSYGVTNNSLFRSAFNKDQSANVGGFCLWGKIPMDSLFLSWENCVKLSIGHKAELLPTVDLHSCLLELTCLNGDNCVSFQLPHAGSMSSSQQVKVNIAAQEVGAKERSPYNSFTYSGVPTSSLPHIFRLRTGNVIFNYRYYNNKLQKTEVTEDFSCPFCLACCASYKGLRYHLCSSHDLFNFEFWVTEELQAVNVSVKSDTWRSEIVADGIDPRLQTFFICSKPRRRRRPKNLIQNAKHVHPHILESDSQELARESLCESLIEKDARSCKGQKISDSFSSENDLQNARHADNNGPNPSSADCIEHVASSPNVTGVSIATAQSSVGAECVQSVSASNLAPPIMLQFAKTRKLSVERSDPRNRLLLQKRQFFHSHRAQPMELEQVWSDRDSEDEVDDDIADFEDRRMLDDFLDVTKDEKQIMHLWNSFVRKQRVLADGHIPWACEAFSRLHGQDLVQSPALIWCWRLFMIKLWTHSLLDGRAMNNCNIILEQYENKRTDPKKN